MEAIDGLHGVVLVTERGEPVLTAAGGFEDADAGVPCSPESRFPVASVSKQFTAVAVLSLVESGALALGSALGDVLPGCPPPWRPVTVHQLLTHTSGLGDWEDVEEFDPAEPGGPDDFLARLARVPLHSPPGTAWRYAGPNYLLAAKVVEHVTGERYPDVLAARIFAPLGMAATTAGRLPGTHRAYGHRGGRRRATADFTAMAGTGDVWSTAGDLARYEEASDGGGLLTPASAALLYAAQVRVPARERGVGATRARWYAYGCFLGTFGGHAARFRRGDAPGHRAFLARLPRRGATVVVLSNDATRDMDDLLEAVLARLV